MNSKNTYNNSGGMVDGESAAREHGDFMILTQTATWCGFLEYSVSEKANGILKAKLSLFLLDFERFADTEMGCFRYRKASPLAFSLPIYTFPVVIKVVCKIDSSSYIFI